MGGNVTEDVQVREDYYVIELTVVSPLSTRTPGDSRVDRDVYFKADRYSDYGGRLKIDCYVQGAQHFKTEKRARAAITRLLERGTICPKHNPRVVRYTETVTRRYKILEPNATVAE